MTAAEGLLIVVVIVLTIFIFSRPKMMKNLKSKEWDCINKETGDMTSVKITRGDKDMSPEMKSQQEQMEYFSVCRDPAEMNKALDCVCGDGENGDGKFAYAENEYGAPGLDYKSWVTANAVDQQVIKNHSD